MCKSKIEKHLGKIAKELERIRLIEENKLATNDEYAFEGYLTDIKSLNGGKTNE